MYLKKKKKRPEHTQDMYWIVISFYIIPPKHFAFRVLFKLSQNNTDSCLDEEIVVPCSWDNRRWMIMIDQMGGRRRRGLAPPGSRLWTIGHTILGSFNLKPGISESFCKVVIDWSCDGYRVCHWLWLLVILAKASAEVFFYHWIAGSSSYRGNAENY